jgi:Fic family protein
VEGLKLNKLVTMSYQFTYTSTIVRYLQEIERSRTAVDLTILPPEVAERLRLQARVRSTHYSTRIEGNRLTLVEAEQAIVEGRKFSDRERDALEVQRYFQGLERIEYWIDQKAAITEDLIRKLHAIIYSGRRSKPTSYRDGQNVVRDSTGGIVYLPPEARDVPLLMSELVNWIDSHQKETPVPVIAGIAHYQFVTIHPFYDGNGRTARALATWILYRGGYDLGRFYALEEFYSKDLTGYYDALATHSHHNYYEGRADAPVTSWLEYLLAGMVSVFENVAREVRLQSVSVQREEDEFLRKLDRRGRIVFGLFTRQDSITSRDVARVLGLSIRQSRELLKEWVSQGWLQVSDPARKSRRYHLSAVYRRFIGEITAGENNAS